MSFERVERDQDHVYRVAGVVVPGVTAICNVIAPPRLEFADPAAVEYRRQIGQMVHEMTALDGSGILDEDTVGMTLWPYLEDWRKLLFDNKIQTQPDAIELTVYSSRHKFAGQLDRRAIWCGQEAILDIKTGTVDLAYCGPQTALYELADREWSGIGGKQRKRLIAQIKGDGKPKLIECTDKRDIDIGLYGLQIWNWRQIKHGTY